MRFRLLLVMFLTGSSSIAHAEFLSQSQTIDAAIAYAGLDRPLDDWSMRARWSALIPEFEASIESAETTTLEDHYRETLAEGEETPFAFKSLQTTTARDDGDRFTLRLKARFKPAGLVFEPAELSAERLARARSAERSRLIRRVSELYARHRALRRQLRSDTNRREAALEELHAIEIELDGLTDQKFTGRTP